MKKCYAHTNCIYGSDDIAMIVMQEFKESIYLFLQMEELES